MDVSFVIPVYNEKDSLDILVDQVKNEMEKLNKLFEIIFINDGSTDKSEEVILNLVRNNKEVKLINLRRNFGKAAALNEGFKKCKGDIVITMDADLQDRPSEIYKLLEKINEGFDMVTGWKENRKDPLEKRLPSKLFNKMTSKFIDLKLHDYNCGFKAYKQEVVKNIVLYGEMHRYIPALAHWKGYRVAEVAVEHSARIYGHSKYGFERYLRGFFDFVTTVFITKYKYKPMHLFGKLGLSLTLIGCLVCAYLSVIWMMGATIGDRPLLILGVLLIIIGVQIFTTGLICELILQFKTDTSNDHFVKEVHSGNEFDSNRVFENMANQPSGDHYEKRSSV